MTINSLYVYETKNVVAYSNVTDATRAERCWNPELWPVLGQCDYLDMRPETDQAFMGKKISCNL